MSKGVSKLEIVVISSLTVLVLSGTYGLRRAVVERRAERAESTEPAHAERAERLLITDQECKDAQCFYVVLDRQTGREYLCGEDAACVEIPKRDGEGVDPLPKG